MNDKFSDFALNWVETVFSLSNKKQPQVKRLLTVDIFPIIGNLNIQDITQSDVLLVTDRIKERGATALALWAKSLLNRIFDYAINREKISFNPAAAIKSQHIGKSSSRNRLKNKRIYP